ASSPVSSTLPESAGSSPAMIRRIVLLPDPDGPSSATSWPEGTSNETSSTAWKATNRFARFLTAMPIPLSLRFVGFHPPADRLHADQQGKRDAGQEQAGSVGALGIEAVDPVVDVEGGRLGPAED